MQIVAIENKVSKAGNPYEIVRLDNGSVSLVPEWLPKNAKLPLSVDIIMKDFGKWVIAPIIA